MLKAAGNLPPYIAAMLEPAFYPRKTAKVELVQTHISYVLLTDDTVYKLKKAVRFAFLDFSTIERRRHFCGEEVRLNRRLAPEVYDGVVAVVRRGASFALADESSAGAVDYAVVMRRLPRDRILASMLERNAVTAEHIERIVGRLVEFHRTADCNEQVRREGAPSRVLAWMNTDFEETRRFRRITITPHDDDAIGTFCRDELRRFFPLIESRCESGRVRDGHGDLHAEHICFTDGLVIFDCIEFNPAFRCRDVAAEVAFLAMDLEYRGHPEFAGLLVRRYSECTADSDLPLLVPLFQAHRAYIRGKVESLKAVEAEVGELERRQSVESARRHFELAYRYTWSRVHCLVGVVGLSGSGKSTLARELHRRTGFVHLNSDVIRKQLAGLPPTSRVGMHDAAGLYSAEHSARTYGEMLRRAGAELAAGRSVIADATFQRREDRAALRAVASAYRTALVLVECRAAEEEVLQRLRQRVADDTDASDADVEIYRRQRARYEPLTDDELALGIVADMSRPLAEVVPEIEDQIRSRALAG